MPAARRMRLGVLIIVLSLLVILYTTTGRRATYSSKFYSRTMAAIAERRSNEQQANVLAGERRRQDRVTRLQEEHEVAMGKAADLDKRQQQKPLVDETGKIPSSPISATDEDGLKAVAGRKKMKDGKFVVDEAGQGTDGVAKVGNVQAKEGSKDASKDGAVKKPTADERAAEDEINAILKKGPIIIFSKSRCPYSARAKNILQNLYTIVPPPHVVELDQHNMGPALQAALGKSTGRTTVPNVLINGKSIGGGDDVQALHNTGKLIDTIQSLAGKRLVEIKKASEGAALRHKRSL